MPCQAKESRRDKPERRAVLSERFEIHHAPKHGSWLNMAEIEISTLSRQCLGRHIPSMKEMAAEVRSWVAQRNAEKATVRWQFTAADARIRLRHLYPLV